jgi:hypothetical protein
MFRLALIGRRRVSTRTRLRLEVFDSRDQPSVLAWDDPANPPPFFFADAANPTPQIVDFNAEQLGNGLVELTGRVVDANPGGMKVLFDGAVPAITGKSVVTDQTGEFSITILVGNQTGTVSAVTTNVQGLTSAPVTVYIGP